MVTTEFYRTSSIKRRTKADMQLIIAGLVQILNEDHPMTNRQVFYQMETRGYVPKTEAAYRTTVCRLLTELRLNGTIPFGYIADNTRWMRKPDTFNTVDEMLQTNIQAYRRSLWTGMPAYIEVWIEKDALAGVISEITYNWDVPLMVTRGYPSLSYLYTAAEVMKSKNKPVYIYYLGDWDPSGLDISRSTESRLREFAPNIDLHFERIAVTAYQIEALHLPTRPTKKTDTRTRNFEGDESVELDAIAPNILRSMVESYITGHIDPEVYSQLRKIEKEEKASLEWVMNHIQIKGDTIYTSNGFLQNNNNEDIQ